MAACSSSTRPATVRSTFALAAISYPKATYVLVSGYIQGDIKFASNSISGAVTQALLSLNPYGLPLVGNEVSIYGYGTAIGALDDSDADAGTLLGILILPANLGYGEDVYFDVTTFVAATNAPFLAFNLRTTDTDVFSSLEFNYGHRIATSGNDDGDRRTRARSHCCLRAWSRWAASHGGVRRCQGPVPVFSFHHNPSPSGRPATTRACVHGFP